MSLDILGTSCDQCRSMVQYSFTSTETRRLVRMDSPGRAPRLSHSSWTMRSVVVGRFFIALFSALEQIHCAEVHKHPVTLFDNQQQHLLITRRENFDCHVGPLLNHVRRVVFSDCHVTDFARSWVVCQVSHSSLIQIKSDQSLLFTIYLRQNVHSSCFWFREREQI